jgi:hypothetical protein
MPRLLGRDETRIRYRKAGPIVGLHATSSPASQAIASFGSDL